LPEGLANQSVTQYTVFCQKRRDIVRREHPGYTQQQIFNILAKQWAELDEEQRSKFIPMGSDVKNLSLIMSPVLSDSGESISIHYAFHSLLHPEQWHVLNCFLLNLVMMMVMIDVLQPLLCTWEAKWAILLNWTDKTCNW